MSSLKVVCLVVGVVIGWPAVAQEGPGHPFYPLGIGDMWEYELAHGGSHAPMALVSYQ